MISKPTPTGTWIDRYINLVTEDNLIAGFKRQTEETLTLLSSLNDEQINFRYAEGKWSIKELLMHMIDTERIFAYRALVFARGEKQAVHGFDENEYVKNCHVDERDWKSLIEEYIVVRTATVATFAGFSEQVLDNAGIANQLNFTPRQLGFATVGHEIHHIGIMKSRYLAVTVKSEQI